MGCGWGPVRRRWCLGHAGPEGHRWAAQHPLPERSEPACHRLHYLRVHLYDELAPTEWAAVDNHLARHLGLRGEAAQHASHLLTSTFGHHRSVVGPGVPQILRGLQSSGKALGVVSKSDWTLAARLAEDGLYSDDRSCGLPIAFIVDSTVVCFAKPSLRIFGDAIERLEALGLDHQRCVFVGDTCPTTYCLRHRLASSRFTWTPTRSASSATTATSRRCRSSPPGETSTREHAAWN